jgi:ABC-type molybdate transport system substrate-binding protein
LLAAAGLLATAAPALARAEWLRDEVVVYCDPALRPVLDAVAAAFRRDAGVSLRIFCAPPGQMLGLLAHGTQDDVLITQAAYIGQGQQAGLVAGGTKLWRNRLLFAAAGAGQSEAAFDAASLAMLVGSGMLAVPDPTPAASVDGQAVVQRLGLAEKLGARVLGAANTGDALAMVRRGDAAVALCHVTEVAQADDVHAAMEVPSSAYDPVDYQVALTKTAWSRNQDRLLAYLSGPARATAASFGLAVMS